MSFLLLLFTHFLILERRAEEKKIGRKDDVFIEFSPWDEVKGVSTGPFIIKNEKENWTFQQLKVTGKKWVSEWEKTKKKSERSL